MDIDPDKALAALEAEKERRLQAKIDSGEVVVRTITVVCAREEDVEEATERELAKHPASDGIHDELLYVFTGVPRAPDYWKEETSSPLAEAGASSEGTLSPPSSEEPARGGEVSPSPPSEPAYIFVTTRAPTDDGDPGAITEALWSVDDGSVVLTTLEGRHIKSGTLLKGVDPAQLARVLLREAEAPKDFNQPIRYPKMGLA